MSPISIPTNAPGMIQNGSRRVYPACNGSRKEAYLRAQLTVRPQSPPDDRPKSAPHPSRDRRFLINFKQSKDNKKQNKNPEMTPAGTEKCPQYSPLRLSMPSHLAASPSINPIAPPSNPTKRLNPIFLFFPEMLTIFHSFAIASTINLNGPATNPLLIRAIPFQVDDLACNSQCDPTFVISISIKFKTKSFWYGNFNTEDEWAQASANTVLEQMD